MSLKDKRVLFYVPNMNALTDGVYHTQVFGLAQYLVRCGAQCVIIHTDATDPEGERVVDGVRFWSTAVDARKVSIFRFPAKLRRLVSPLEPKIKAFAPTHIYARDSYAGLAALTLVKKMGAKFVFSCRGAGLAKSDTSLKVRIKEMMLWVVTWRVLNSADHVSSVCENLREHLKTFYHCKAPMSVLPCCAMEEKFAIPSEENRTALRQALNMPAAAKVVVYCGYIGGYQDGDGIVAMMKAMRDRNPSFVFLFLTEELNELKNIARRVGLPEGCFRALTCHPSEVASYLHIATAAFCLRTNDEVTRLCSPIKIGEYLAAGLGVIYSPWIGDMGRLLKSRPFAFAYDGTQAADELVAFVNAIDATKREAGKTFARSYYSYDGNRGSIEEMFA